MQHSSAALTWHGHKKLDSIPMSMETELGVGHGAVRHSVGRHAALRTAVGINTDSCARMMRCSSWCLVGCRKQVIYKHRSSLWETYKTARATAAPTQRVNPDNFTGECRCTFR